MAFNQDVKDQAYNRSGGRCEYCGKPCRRVWNGEFYNYPDSEFHHVEAEQYGGKNLLSNCAHLCISCHEKTASYGKH